MLGVEDVKEGGFVTALRVDLEGGVQNSFEKKGTGGARGGLNFKRRRDSKQKERTFVGGGVVNRKSTCLPITKKRFPRQGKRAASSSINEARKGGLSNRGEKKMTARGESRATERK